jgi:hypothetical protein
MKKQKAKTKLKDKENTLAEELNKVPIQNEEQGLPDSFYDNLPDPYELIEEVTAKVHKRWEADAQYREQIKEAQAKLFDEWEAGEVVPKDYNLKVPADSLESRVGYSSLIRQLQNSYTRMIAHFRSEEGGALAPEQAREQAFHRALDTGEAKELFQKIMSYSYHDIFLSDLYELNLYAPRVAERLWEKIKQEGRKEFESGHLAANNMFPVDYMKQAWNIARYLRVRESFAEEWQPKGGIEIAMIDTLAQAYFQWQYWLEQTIKRSETREREEHPDYQEWKRARGQSREKSWTDGFWLRPYVSEQQAIDHAMQAADRWNRIFMRTLRQLRDLRRYSPVTINNPSQVNIATDGGQQINVKNEKEESERIKQITS